METAVIKIAEVVGESLCIASEDGAKVHQAIKSMLDEGLSVELSFEGVTDITTAFLNVAVGMLYFEYDPVFLKERMRPPVSADHWMIEKLAQSVKRAKEVALDPERFRKAAEEILRGGGNEQS